MDKTDSQGREPGGRGRLPWGWMALLGALVLAACGGSGGGSSSDPAPPPPLVPERSTWEVIQSEILDRSCTDCHRAGTSFARQSDLVLTGDVAYDQLVNRVPHNAAAAGEGLLLVGTEGTASLLTSYLWEKIYAPNSEHFFNEHEGYGQLMPLGEPVLTNGDLALIEEWIVAGAPETGVVAAEALRSDTTRWELLDFEPLPPPVDGIQIHLGPFEVPANYERSFYYYVPFEELSDEAVYLSGFQVAMRAGSHHFNLYEVPEDAPDKVRTKPGVYREVRGPDGSLRVDAVLAIFGHRFLIGTQSTRMTNQLPKGVAFRLEPASGLDLNTHAVNRTSQGTIGEVYVNLLTVDESEVEHVAQFDVVSRIEIELPPRRVTTLEETAIFGESRSIFQMVSHAHELMTEFKVYRVGGERDGELIYVARDWEHPPILQLDPPLVVERGEGLRIVVTYDNPTDETIRFGFLSVDEMMVLYYSYYTD